MTTPLVTPLRLTTPWPPERRAQLLAHVRQHGGNHAKLAALMGTSPAAISSIVRSMRAEWASAKAEYAARECGRAFANASVHAVPVIPLPSAPPPDEAAPDEFSSALLDSLGRWRPVVLPAPVLRPCVYTASPVDVVGGDFHFPEQDDRAVAVFLGAIERLRPERVILIGDLWDLTAFSKYDKEVRATLTHTPQDEVRAGAEFLSLLETTCSAFGGKVVILPGNHEARWWAYLNRHAPALVSHPRAEALLDFRRWWVPEWSTATWQAEDIVIPGTLPIIITHGEIVRQQAGYSANAHGKKYHAGVLHGHTHRMGQSTEMVPGLTGYRDDAWIDSYEVGCLATLQPPYARRPNWAHGFAVVTRSEHEQANAVELVKIRDGRAMVGALGGSVAA